MPKESTTPDPLETGRRIVEVGSRRDFDALMPLFSADAVFDRSAVGLEVIEGREAICGFLEEWIGAWEEFEAEMEEGRDLGHGVTFAVISQRGRLPGSTSWVRDRYANVSIWADGLIQLSRTYGDIDEARAAAERLAEERG